MVIIMKQMKLSACVGSNIFFVRPLLAVCRFHRLPLRFQLDMHEVLYATERSSPQTRTPPARPHENGNKKGAAVVQAPERQFKSGWQGRCQAKEPAAVAQGRDSKSVQP